MRFIKRKLWIILLALLVIVGGAYKLLLPEPLAGLAKIKADRVEKISQQYPDGTGELTRTYYFSGKNAQLALDQLKNDLPGNGWKLRASDVNYAYFSASIKPLRNRTLGFYQSKNNGKNVSASPGTDDVYWLMVDDGTQRAVVHEYRQVSKQRASLLTLLRLMNPAPPSSSIFTAGTLRSDPNYALLVASEKGDVAAAQAAVDRGASVTGASISQPPITVALRAGRVAVAQLLLDHGANINTPMASGRNAVDIACGCNPEALKFAFAHGAKFSDDGAKGLAECASQYTPVDYLIERAEQPLEEHPPVFLSSLKIAYVGQVDGMAFDDAGWRNSAAAAQILLDHGAKVDGVCRIPDFRRRTALQLAAGAGNAPLVKVLLGAGADPTLRDPNGQTAREIAMNSKDNRWRETVQLLDEALAKRKAPAKK